MKPLVLMHQPSQLGRKQMIKKYHPVYKEEYEQWIAAHQQEIEEVSKDPRRLHYHLMPKIGWLNDPNGLCQLKGTYHIYYQYDPFDVRGELKLWQHVTTKDFIHYEEQEPFLFPDSELDTHGAYSGSAFIQGDTIHYFYTGNIKLFDRDDYDYIHNGRVANTIHLTSKDGVHFDEKQLVMGMQDYPKGFTQHIRDPKIIEEDGIFYMVQGARDMKDHGAILLFASQDLNHWQYVRSLQSDEPFGYMWECPDLFELEGQKILITCPQGVDTQGVDYANVHSTVWMQVDGTIKDSLRISQIHQLDRGFDFYAPQSFQDEQGRRILIGWMGIPDADYTNPTTEDGWQHALTIPRELHWKDGKLFQQPLSELKVLRKETLHFNAKSLCERQYDGECYELEALFQECEQMTLSLNEEIQITYQDHLFTLDITKCGYKRTTRSVYLDSLNNTRIFSDTSSLEIFLNDGSEVFTTRIYPTRPRCVTLNTKEGDTKITLYPLTAHQVK